MKNRPIRFLQITRRTSAQKLCDSAQYREACEEALHWLQREILKGTVKTAQNAWDRCPVGVWLEWTLYQLPHWHLTPGVLAQFKKLRVEFGCNYADDRIGSLNAQEFADAIREQYESPWL